ncbi:MAG: Gfo/Idh/MocA family oxidoreductase [Deltaproteobacteria bacterium]|nr:Gfo/Idh/MocA family oxidoreductase [Deltaproteobacteria bacterium]
MSGNKKIKTGVVGTGYLGRFHAQKYAALENSELIGVFDLDSEKCASVAAETNSTPLSAYSELFGKAEAVSIVTPTKTHHKVAKEFLERGIHVLLEKPMTVTLEEADDLIETSNKSGAILQIGHLERFNPAVLALKDRVTEPLFIEAHRLSQFSPRALDVDVVLDLMIHDIDIIMNFVKSEIESVEAAGIPVISGKVDIANARITFKNGCVANITASRISKDRMRRTRIFQRDTYIAIDYATQKIELLALKRGTGPMPEIVEEKLDIEKGDSLLEEIKSFLNCVATKTAPLVGAKDGKRALQVAALVQEKTEQSLQKAAGRLKTLS